MTNNFLVNSMPQKELRKNIGMDKCEEENYKPVEINAESMNIRKS